MSGFYRTRSARSLGLWARPSGSRTVRAKKWSWRRRNLHTKPGANPSVIQGKKAKARAARQAEHLVAWVALAAATTKPPVWGSVRQKSKTHTKQRRPKQARQES